MTGKQFRALALSLPEAHEAPHFERTSFRVGKKIFATMTPDGTEAMVRVAPRERMTQFFGLYALTGKVTSFFGPLAVAVLTSLSGSQRIGISVLLLFFIVGGVSMIRVQPRRG